jgi:ADP-ribose pyrophosphatase YjhB (NUDIX family)
MSLVEHTHDRLQSRRRGVTSVDAAEIDHVEEEDCDDEAADDEERFHECLGFRNPVLLQTSFAVDESRGRRRDGMTTIRTALEPLLTPLFRSWWRLRRSMTLGVRALTTDGDGRVLLVRHSYMEGWYLPGGGVEHGETAEGAVRRELAEEGGVEALDPPVLIGVYSQHATFPNDHVLLYRVSAWRPCAPTNNGEILQASFFPPDALPHGTTPATIARIAETLRGAPQSLYW